MSAIVLDTETTGFDPSRDRVIELSILPWSPGVGPSLKEAEFLFDRRFNPGFPLPPKITEITGITDEMLRDCDRVEAHAARICEIITSAEAVIGYNVAFDKRMISADLKRCGFDPTWPILVDPMRVWDVCEPREKRDLQNAFKRFVDSGGFVGAHGAPADTWATREVLRAQFDHFALHEKKWDELDPQRAIWWGTSKHVIVVEDELIVNFGKHESRPVYEVDVGFWRWVSQKDFPDHMLLLAMKMIEFVGRHRGEELRRVVNEWGLAYREKIV